MTAEGAGESVAGPVDAGGTADGTTEFRNTPRQLRNLLIWVLIGLGVAVAAGSIAVITRSAGAAELAVTAGICGLIFLYAYLAYGFARTAFGPTGISGRNFGGRYEYRWEQIDNVACRAYTSRGMTTYSVILTTTDGDRIRLGAPVSGGAMGDPAFAAKYARIRQTWQAATGHTGPEADTKSIWTRGFILLVAGFFAQCIAVAVIATIVSVYGPAFAAHEGKGAPGTFTSEVRNCADPGCTWFGTFTAAGNVKYATLAPGGPVISQPGVNVSAVDSGEQDTVYPPGGGAAWKGPAAGLAVTSAVAVVILMVELAVLRHHRRRRRRSRALGRAATG
jgi:hypothetical protein